MKNKLFDFSFVIKSLGCEYVGLNQGLISSIVIDSREAKDEVLFIPLIGEFANGNDYIESALYNGCKFSLVTRDYYMDNIDFFNRLLNEFQCGFCIVENTLKALQDLAKAYIKKFKKLRIIAITGSSGKTTTKEVLGSIFSFYDSTLVTNGNYNSETGLPLTVFRIREEHKFAVLEIGMSKPGEIKALVDIINPEVSVITNIGTAHIGFFDSRDGIAKEKKDAFANFSNNNIGVIPEWDDYFDYLRTDVNGELLVVKQNPDYITEIEDRGFEGWRFNYEGIVVNYPYIGKYNLLNAFLAISCSRRLGLPAASIVKGVEGVKSLFGRGEVLDGKNRVIRDCYNANPQSTLGSLELLNKTKWDGDKVAILGSMLELGDRSFTEHTKVANKAVGYGFSKLILFGQEYLKVYEKYKDLQSVYYFGDMSELKSSVDVIIKEGSLVLLKASRGEKLENITDSIL